MKIRWKMGQQCHDTANIASGNKLTREELEDAFQRVAEQKARLQAEGDITGMPDKLRTFAEREAERTRIAGALQKRHAALNILARDRLDKAIDGFIAAGLSPRKAILAVMEGTQRGVEGGRNSVAALNLAYEARYLGAMMSELQAHRPHLLHVLGTKQMDDDIAREMAELREGGRPGITRNEDAKYVAKLLSTYAEMSRTDLNRLGASIGKLDGWSGAQTHDDVKMIAAGKDAWLSAILPRLDLARTFPDATTSKEIEDALSGIYDTLITGLPNKPTPREVGQRVNPANLAKSLGKSRVLHFKDAEAAIAYRDQFGYGNTFSGVVDHLRNAARTASVMETFGPNPDIMFGSIVEGQRRKIKDASVDAAEQAEKLAALDRRASLNVDDPDLTPSEQKKKQEARRAFIENEKARIRAAGFMSPSEKAAALKGLNAEAGQIRYALDVATGAISRPVNVTAAKIGTDIRAVQSMAKLGGAVFSSFSDNITTAAASQFRGGGFLRGLTSQLGGMMKGRPKGEQAEIAYLIGEGFDGIIGHIVSPAAAQDGPVGKLSKLQEKFFKWNGLSWWTDVQRATASRMISAEMAMRAKVSFGDLPPNYRHVLSLHGINDAMWEAIRKVESRSVEGRDYITPDRIRDLSDNAIRPLIDERLNKLDADLNARATQRRARDEREAEWVVGRKQKLTEWQQEADARLQSMLDGNEIRTEIERQSAQRNIELEKAKIEAAEIEVEMLDAARGSAQGDVRNLLNAVADGADPLKIAEKTDAILDRINAREQKTGQSVGVRRQRALVRIRSLEQDIKKLTTRSNKADQQRIAAVNSRFQTRLKELNDFVDRSFEREQQRADAAAKDAAGHPERVAKLYDDGRRELELAVLRFFADETSYGVVEVDAASRRLMTQGQRPGTFAGEAMRFIGQFKGFPAAFTTRVLGRALLGHSADATRLERIGHIGTLMAGMTVSGYMSLVMKDLMRGYWPPRDPAQPETLAAAFVQGGGAGLYGDFLFSQTSRFGSGVLETLAGPTIGAVAEGVEIGLAARDVAVGKVTGNEANFPAARALTATVNNTPFVNLFYVRPALDYLFLNSMREAASPGYMRKQVKRRQTDYGQTKAPFLPSSLEPFN